MPLYDDDEDSPSQGKGSADITMKFLQAQIAQKRVQIQQGMQRTSVAPVVDLSARNKAGINLRRIQPVRALPITECAPPSFLPKGAVDDSVNLFGEYIVKNEYQPAVPNEYITFKRKAEEREAREKLAREVAERLSRDHKEEAKKRQRAQLLLRHRHSWNLHHLLRSRIRRRAQCRHQRFFLPLAKRPLKGLVLPPTS